jgi:NDP-sugar pyrophosphorylase family protein
MKAVLLAGGKGTRLRPLTLHTPKPIVPIFDRPFLQHQIDLLKTVPEINEVILSLNYQPRRIEEMFGDGTSAGLKIRYVVEPNPLGTGGAIKFAAQGVDDTLVVFNGDVLTEVDLAAVLGLHRERRAAATIVLTPVDNPTAYGLVETDAAGNVSRFLEKPDPNQITCNTINAGIYVLDIGTPEKYVQVHRDVMAGRFHAAPFKDGVRGVHRAPTAQVEAGAELQAPCFLDEGVVVRAGAKVLANSVIGRQVHVEEGATVAGSIVWTGSWIGKDADVRDAVLGRNCSIGRNASVRPGAVLGDKTVVTDYSRI